MGHALAPVAPKNRNTDPGVTNIRNLGLPHWRRWLGPEHRCLVPFTSFSEYQVEPDNWRTPFWFARCEDCTLLFLRNVDALDIVRKVEKQVADLYGFLTTGRTQSIDPSIPSPCPSS